MLESDSSKSEDEFDYFPSPKVHVLTGNNNYKANPISPDLLVVHYKKYMAAKEMIDSSAKNIEESLEVKDFLKSSSIIAYKYNTSLDESV